ncbi:MAG: hypothetical protein AAGP08_04435 [Pseudomonadota bacterium]
MFAPPPATGFAQMRADLGWCEIAPAVAASRFAVTLRRGDRVAGFGRHFVNTLVNEIEKDASPGSMIMLMAAADKERFHDRLGSTRRPNATHGAGMSRVVGA